MRKIGYLLLAAAVALSLTACAKKVTPSPSATPGPTSGSAPATGALEASASAVASPAPVASIPVNHDLVILGGVPAALKSAAQVAADQDTKLPDLSTATPEITSYILVARTAKNDYLFEVFGDGKAYEMYEYPKKPNPAKLHGGKLPSEEASVLQEPRSAGETSASAAVQAVMDKSPAGQARVFIYGYNIGFVGKNGKPVKAPEGGRFLISVDPSGKLVEM